MLKKINKQREKIERLSAKESDAAEKLAQLRQELAGERDALDEMEKEHLFSLMRERALSLEESIALLEKGAEVLLEDVERDASEDTETEEQEVESADETESALENIFTEDLATDFIEKQKEGISDSEAANELDSFWRR